MEIKAVLIELFQKEYLKQKWLIRRYPDSKVPVKVGGNWNWSSMHEIWFDYH